VLNNLDPGVHTVRDIRPVAGTGTAVRTAFDITSSATEVCVGDGATATLNVTFSPVITGGKLWVGSKNSGTTTLVGYNDADILATATVNAAITGTTKGYNGITFDANGNLWVLGATFSDPLIARYPASQFGTSGAKQPDFTVPMGSNWPGSAIAFDAAGNLWVAISFQNAVYRFARVADGTVETTPSVVININNSGSPVGLAFDNANRLWVADNNTDRLLGYNYLTINPSGGIVGTLTIATADIEVTTGLDVRALAFDQSDTLWVVSFTQAKIYNVSPAQRAATGAITPGTAFVDGGGGAIPVSIAIDERGLIWVGGNAGIVRAYNTSGVLQTTITSASTTTELNYGQSLAFYPAPASLPLYHSLP